ncbi:hypothetical protein [Streptosporangium canum]|uniref:hypothetical protein n=1 Tax=Streptosporangium canum TaxID=324952 RepID=UPI00379C15E7
MRNHDYPGEFLFLRPSELKVEDAFMEPPSPGCLIANPVLGENGSIVLTVEGGRTFSLPDSNKVRIFRPDDPCDVGTTCVCGVETGQEHNVSCTLFDDLRRSAQMIWHHFEDGPDLIGWDLPGVFQVLPRSELVVGDIVFEPGMLGRVGQDWLDRSVLISFDDEPTRILSGDELARIFRPADPQHVSACTDFERTFRGYGTPCEDDHSTDYCLNRDTLTEIAYRLWRGLEDEIMRAYEEQDELSTLGPPALTPAAQECATRFIAAMETAARAAGATASTHDQRMSVAWRGEVSYTIDSGLLSGADHGTDHNEVPTFLAIHRTRPVDKHVEYRFDVAGVAFPLQHACNVGLHADLAMAAIARDRRLLAEAPHQA